jgi:glycosyltransferase involved in cell wall biosynthesis
MKILHVTESHERAAGGVSTVVDQLIRYLSRAGQQVGLLSVGRNPMAVPPHVVWRNLPSRGVGRAWGAGPGLRSAVEELLDGFKPDVVHLHGAWLAAQWLTARAAWKRRVPFLVSFHGMLEPYEWNERGVWRLVKKRTYWLLMGKPAFSRAACIHAVTGREQGHLNRFVAEIPGVVIPNAVDLGEADKVLAKLGRTPARAVSRSVGYIGRLHPGKGVELLLRAFETLAPAPPWELCIAGPDQDPSYSRRLRSLASRSPLRERIRFMGPLYDEAKWGFLRDLWTMVLPSFSEVVGVVNLEAGASGTPTITTHSTGLSDWEESGGLLVEPNEDAVTHALARALSWSAAERSRRGARARAFVERRHSWNVVGAQWLTVYERLAGETGTAEPEDQEVAWPGA